MSESKDNVCSFSFDKDGVKIPCNRRPVMELDDKKFCKLHGEVYVLENFDLPSNPPSKDSDEHK